MFFRKIYQDLWLLRNLSNFAGRKQLSFESQRKFIRSLDIKFKRDQKQYNMQNTENEGKASLHELFLVFMKIGAFTIGGGYAMIPLIKDELDKRHWIGEDELPDIIALAQSAPGILAVNVSIFTGYKIRGVKGSIAATIGSVLPSFLIILAIAMAFSNFQDNPVVISIFKGIRPVVVSLIAAPMISMAKKSDKTWWAWMITILSLLAVAFLQVSPIYIIIVVIVLALAFAKFRERR